MEKSIHELSSNQRSEVAPMSKSVETAMKGSYVNASQVISSLPSLSSYTDYRQYLRDWYEFKKRESRTSIRSYSYATFSAAADIKSPNYLKLIIEGQRNLSSDMVKKFARALQLSREATLEFEVLVLYGQAKDPLERNRFLKDLADIRVKKQLKNGEIKAETWEKVPSWVAWVLHALADQEGADFSIESLQELMRGRANREEIKKSLQKLLEAGELVRQEDGSIVKGRILMEGSEDVPVALVRKLQAELIYLGLESLFQYRADEREFGAFTLALKEEEFEQVKFELRQLRKRLYKTYSMERETSKGDRVYQMNIQLFPVTEKSQNS